MSLSTPHLEQATSSAVRRLWGPKTAAVSFVPIAGDASSRSYVRATLSGPSAPPTIVVMHLTGSSLSISSDELQTLPETPAEEPFVNVHRYLESLGAHVPSLYLYDKEANIILLQDLGNRLLWEEVKGKEQGKIVKLYKAAIDVLLALQVEATHHPDSKCIAFKQRFDERLFMWEFDHFLEFGLERRLHCKLTEQERGLFTRHFSAISRLLAAEPTVLSHRDFHSWNLMVSQERIYMIDFQDALLAPGQYDLASLLTDRNTAEAINPAIEALLMDHYLSERKRREAEQGHTVNLDKTHFRQLYFLAVLQRALKVIGRFYFLALEKGKTNYLGFIPHEVRQVRRALEAVKMDKELISAFDQHPWPEEGKP